MKTDTETEEILVEPVYKSTWARQMSQVSLENQLRIATEAAGRLEGRDEGQESEFKRQERGQNGR